jgi:hypothetical protein
MLTKKSVMTTRQDLNDVVNDSGQRPSDESNHIESARDN